MPNFRKKSLSLATAIAGVLTFGSMVGCSQTDNETTLQTDSAPPAPLMLSRENPGDYATDEFLAGPTVLVGRWDNAKNPSYKQFNGIKYAQAPMGVRRFAPPVANKLPAYPAVNMSGDFGTQCPQPSSSGLFGYGNSAIEDCLFLNVSMPANATAASNLPVMVWIHGGAYIYGDGGSWQYKSSYDPARLVAEGVVVVTLNYRLGALGFLAHSELTAENNAANGELPGESGNYGLLDQRMALRWVQQNIRSFGGNPANVTVFGESAGGQSVLSHLVSPGSAGLFHKAIVQSGSYIPTQQSLAQGEYLGTQFVNNLTCTGQTTLACLRGKTVAEILTAQTAYVNNTLGGNALFQATTGTNVLPVSIAQALSEGDINPVTAVMAGANLNEGTLFTAIIPAASSLTTLERYNAKVASLFAPLLASSLNYDEVQIASDFLAGQDSGDAQRFNKAYSELYTQFAFTCNQYTQLQQLSAEVDTYGYHFTDQQAYSALRATAPYIGATHTAEIQYVWSSAADFTAKGHTANQLALSNQMIDYWTNFAKSEVGDPNGGTLPTWNSFDNAEAMIQLDDPGATSTTGTVFADDDVHNCDYWDAANEAAFIAGHPG